MKMLNEGLEGLKAQYGFHLPSNLERKHFLDNDFLYSYMCAAYICV